MHKYRRRSKLKSAYIYLKAQKKYGQFYLDQILYCYDFLVNIPFTGLSRIAVFQTTNQPKFL